MLNSSIPIWPLSIPSTLKASYNVTYYTSHACVLWPYLCLTFQISFNIYITPLS